MSANDHTFSFLSVTLATFPPQSHLAAATGTTCVKSSLSRAGTTQKSVLASLVAFAPRPCHPQRCLCPYLAWPPLPRLVPPSAEPPLPQPAPPSVRRTLVSPALPNGHPPAPPHLSRRHHGVVGSSTKQVMPARLRKKKSIR
jgi:hypothetical protein